MNYCYNLEMLKLSINKKKIYINLRGGLGNQLFCYFVGEYLRQQFEVTIVYVYHSKSNVHHRFNSKINSFNLMWAGYWSADYFRSKNLFIKNILLKIQNHVHNNP